MRHALAGPSLMMCLGMALPAAAQNSPSREIMDQAQSVQAGEPEPAPDAALPPPFVEAAREAFLQAHFAPGERQGMAVKSRIDIEVSFDGREADPLEASRQPQDTAPAGRPV